MRNRFSQNRLSLTLCPARVARIMVFDAHQADRTRLLDYLTGNNRTHISRRIKCVFQQRRSSNLGFLTI